MSPPIGSLSLSHSLSLSPSERVWGFFKLHNRLSPPPPPPQVTYPLSSPSPFGGRNPVNPSSTCWGVKVELNAGGGVNIPTGQCSRWARIVRLIFIKKRKKLKMYVQYSVLYSCLGCPWGELRRACKLLRCRPEAGETLRYTQHHVGISKPYPPPPLPAPTLRLRVGPTVSGHQPAGERWGGGGYSRAHQPKHNHAKPPTT